MSKQRYTGDLHVKSVAEACKQRILNQPINQYSEITIETVNYIFEKFPKITAIRSKFDFSTPDTHPDITVIEKGGVTNHINLFLIKGYGSIQPKNLGAKSFFSKYFLSPDIQQRFNKKLEIAQGIFYKQILNISSNAKVSVSTLKKMVKVKKIKFEASIEPFRKAFLFQLREDAFDLMREEYSLEVEKTKHAFKQLLMMDAENIITRRNDENKCLLVETYKSIANPKEELQIYKKAQNSIGIRAGEEALILRFKFESNPTSSIKLATSYERFTFQEKILKENQRVIELFNQFILNHSEESIKNISNAIGKVNEAIVYYEILKQQPQIYQTDSRSGLLLMDDFAKYITNKDLKYLLNAARGTSQKIISHIEKKYPNYRLDSIQLVPDSYLKNRLDTSDLKIVIKKGNIYKEENLSLKALAKKSAKITSKNPGAGTILGPHYFHVKDLKEFLLETKRLFLEGRCDHQKCLERVSDEVYTNLSTTFQENLQKGVRALLGESTLVVTFYKINDTLVLEHEDIRSEIKVVKHSNSAIQTILQWSGGHEELSLRVKFSSSQKKGWSSMKLACEYTITR